MGRMRGGTVRSFTTSTISAAGLAVLLSCGGQTTPLPVSPSATTPATQEIPITGAAVPGMGSYDQLIPDLMRKHAIPGGAVAVLRDGKLIYARGFGYADVDAKVPAQPDALFRIASVSKPITGVAIMKLVEEGKLQLDDRVAPLIAHLAPAPGATVDPRWEQITIRQLLNHTGGWDRDKPGGFDPMFRPATAAAAVGAPAPASAETVIRYMKGLPLDFTPGTRHVYSNFGYAILGRVIERLSGMPYEDYVRERVLQPVGAQRTRLGKTRMSEALPDEVKYYMPGEPGLGLAGPLVPSVFPGEGPVPITYGFYMEALDSHGGWVSSTIDLLRFTAGVDGRASRPDILSPALVSEMTSNGVAVACSGGECSYAGGWLVRPVQGDATWWHGGSLPGTTTLLVRSYHNFSWVAAFNARTSPGNFAGELDAALWTALGQVSSFPAHDLFSIFP